MILEKILQQILNENVNVNDITNAIDNHKRIIINYHSNGEDNATGARVIEVYAYGLTKAGNPVIRAFQPFGDTTSRTPSWKFFRLDRISSWKETKQTFNHPASFYYKGLGEFNPNGDETMSIVYKIISFDNNFNSEKNVNGPKLKNNNEIFKTDTEHNIDRVKQQLNNPITINDLKIKQGFKNVINKNNDSGPKQKEKTYKTNTERNIDKLTQQSDNPKKIDLNNLEGNRIYNKKNLQDIIKQNKQEVTPNSSNEEEVYKTDTERNIEKLKQQLENPKKIDLNKIPKR